MRSALDAPNVIKLRKRDAQLTVVIESFTPEVRELARTVPIWRPLALSREELAQDGLNFLKTASAA